MFDWYVHLANESQIFRQDYFYENEYWTKCEYNIALMYNETTLSENLRKYPDYIIPNKALSQSDVGIPNLKF